MQVGTANQETSADRTVTEPDLLARPSVARWTVGDWILVATVAVAALTVLIVHRTPPLASDQMVYFRSAVDPSNADPSHHSTRLGLVLPVWAAIESLGNSESAYSVVPILFSIGLALAVFSLGRVLFGRWVGMAAAVLVLLNPIIFRSATTLMPDIPFTATFTGGIALVLAAAIRFSSGSWDRRCSVLFVAGGILLGWSYLIRETALIFYPVVPVTLLIYRIALRRWLLLAAPVAAAVLFEMVWGWLVWGSPLTRLAVITQRSVEEVPQWIVDVSARALQQQRSLTTLGTFPGMLADTAAGWVPLILGVVMVVIGLVKRDRRVLVMLAWLIVGWATLTVAGLFPRLIRLSLPRYWYPLVPPLIVGGLGSISILSTGPGLRSRWEQLRRPAVTALLSIAVVTAMTLTADHLLRMPGNFVGRGGDHYQELRLWLQGAGSEVRTLWTDNRTVQVLPLFARSPFGTPTWTGQIRTLNDGDDWIDPREIDGSVVLTRLYLTNVFRRTYIPLADYVVAPPATWTLQAMTENGEISVFDTESSTEEVTLFEVGHQPRGPENRTWRYRGVRGTTMRQSGGESMLLTLEEGGFAQIRDTPSRGPHSPVISSTIAARSVLALRLELEVIGEPTVRVLCEFAEAGGAWVGVPAMTFFLPPRSYGPVDFYCMTPEALSGQLHVRTKVGVSGSGTVRIGSLVARESRPLILGRERVPVSRPN